MGIADTFTLLIIGIVLSMDAFAVSIAQGACLNKVNFTYALKIGATFGLFQAFMPIVGWTAGATFNDVICRLDHWIALILLSAVGINMIRVGFKGEESSQVNELSCPTNKRGQRTNKALLLLGVATSIDALAVGFTFKALCIPIIPSAVVIGLITFIISGSGIYLGKKSSAFLEGRVEIAGGILLILIGLKIFIEHIVKGI
jgi:putative Mn2+ efflux pump MntP